MSPAAAITGLVPVTLVGAEVAVAEPAPFVAVTAARSRDPTSAAVTTYVAEVAPAIDVHEPPDESQRSHL